MYLKKAIKKLSSMVLAVSILMGCCLSSYGASSISVISSGGSYYAYQWALKNDGSISSLTSRVQVPEVRRGAGEEPGGRGRRGGSMRPMFGLMAEQASAAVSGIDINAESAWLHYEQTSERRTVTVALIDTGVDTTHPELAGGIWVNPGEIAGDGIDNDGNGYIDDINGWNFYAGSGQVYAGDEDEHGTHGAGTIISAWDGSGTTGIADSIYVKIMVLKVFGSEESTGNVANVKEAIRYAEANGASICNLSIGTYNYDAGLEELMSSSSMLFVVSAGNGDSSGCGYSIDSSPIYPASFTGSNIISVANLMYDGTLSQSSNYGAAGVDLAAPGSFILSTLPEGDYGFMSGTSMAAPVVTGIAALIYSCRTDMSIMDVRTAILSTCRSLTDLSGKLVTGGMPDAYAAITYGL